MPYTFAPTGSHNRPHAARPVRLDYQCACGHRWYELPEPGTEYDPAVCDKCGQPPRRVEGRPV